MIATTHNGYFAEFHKLALRAATGEQVDRQQAEIVCLNCGVPVHKLDEQANLIKERVAAREAMQRAEQMKAEGPQIESELQAAQEKLRQELEAFKQRIAPLEQQVSELAARKHNSAVESRRLLAEAKQTLIRTRGSAEQEASLARFETQVYPLIQRRGELYARLNRRHSNFIGSARLGEPADNRLARDIPLATINAAKQQLNNMAAQNLPEAAMLPIRQALQAAEAAYEPFANLERQIAEIDQEIAEIERERGERAAAIPNLFAVDNVRSVLADELVS